MKPPELVARRVDFDFSQVPRDWNAGSAPPTAVANGVSLLLPAGEVFLVRTLGAYASRIADPVLRAQVRGFCAQEGRHSVAHERYNARLRADGYPIDGLIGYHERVFGWLERRSPGYKLAIAAALEMYTAFLLRDVFRLGDPGGIFDAADPTMKAFWAWHATEELEHKAVCYDVLQAFAPSYLLRIAGLIGATVLLGGLWFVSSRRLVRHDGWTVPGAILEISRIPATRDPVVLWGFGKGFVSYLRPGFHPNDDDTTEVAAAWYAAHGLEMPG